MIFSYECYKSRPALQLCYFYITFSLIPVLGSCPQGILVLGNMSVNASSCLSKVQPFIVPPTCPSVDPSIHPSVPLCDGWEPWWTLKYLKRSWKEAELRLMKGVRAMAVERTLEAVFDRRLSPLRLLPSCLPFSLVLLGIFSRKLWIWEEFFSSVIRFDLVPSGFFLDKFGFSRFFLSLSRFPRFFLSLTQFFTGLTG